jgi:NTP pyrophosphatase (non-canonical NTP hydrolase)
MNTTEHLLTCLSEECLEVAKDVSKSLRFGLTDVNVLQPDGPTNRERIVEELNDLMAVIKMCEAHGIIPLNWKSAGLQETKKEKVERFMHYAASTGSLTGYPK